MRCAQVPHLAVDRPERLVRLATGLRRLPDQRHDLLKDRADLLRVQRRSLDRLPPIVASWAMASDISKAELSFPVTFDLRLIYVLAEGAAIREDLERILAERQVAWTLMQGDAKEGAKYGRFGVRLTMTSREQMYGVYEDLGKLKYIKTAI